MKTRTKNIIRTITLIRLWNLFVLKVSFFLSSTFKKTIHFGGPMAISIEPTTTCNLQCPQCPSGLREFTRPIGNIDLQLNKKILDQVGKQLQHINYYFQGEPFIHPQFLDLVSEARKRNIYVVTSTNAHFIKPETAEKIVLSDLSEIIISIDGITQESYEKYRINGKLDKVLEGVGNLVAAKRKLKRKNPVIVFQFLVVKYNENEIESLYALAKDMGVDEVRLKTIQIYNFETGNDLIPENEKYSRYKVNADGKYTLKNSFKNKCWRMWSSCVFTWDGKIVPCCFDKDAKYTMGTINSGGFNKIWKSSIYSEFRSKIIQDRKTIDICKNCSEGSKVWV